MPFSAIVGHRPLLQLIARAVDHDTLPPSLLLVGPEGVGKKLAAGALAQVLNCTAPVRTSEQSSPGPLVVDACGSCSACTRIARGSFADVLTIAPSESGTIVVDEVRHAVGQAAYRPFEGRRRVVLIDDADRLVPHAQNALLKTLEEPPESSQFVLVTARPDMLLATVRSRCQRLTFGQLRVSEVARLLVDQGVKPDVARVTAASSGGSIGRALQMTSGDLTAARDAAMSLLTTVARARDVKGRLEGARGLMSGAGKGGGSSGARQTLGQRLQALTSLIRDVELVAAGADPTGLANADLDGGLRTLAQVYGGERGLSAFTAVGAALSATEGNASPKVVADWLACQL